MSWPQHGDATQLANLVPHAIVRCNSFATTSWNIATIRALCCALRLRALRDSSAILSVLVRNQGRVKCSRQLSRREIWLQRKMASPLSRDKKPFTEAGCDYSPRIACDPCCQRAFAGDDCRAKAYASLRTTYRRGFSRSNRLRTDF